jgi:hypothetical protein
VSMSWHLIFYFSCNHTTWSICVPICVFANNLYEDQSLGLFLLLCVAMSNHPDSERDVCIAAAEAMATRAAETTRQAAAPTQATVAATVALRVEAEQPRASESPHRHRVLSPSPKCCHRRGGCHGSPIIQTVIKEVVGSMLLPLLTKMNYNEWSLMMKV